MASDSPKVWFTSTESFAKVLSAGNRDLLRIIAEKAPGSLDELARITGKAKSNLFRTLRTMEGYALDHLERGERRADAPEVGGQNPIGRPSVIGGYSRSNRNRRMVASSVACPRLPELMDDQKRDLERLVSGGYVKPTESRASSAFTLTAKGSEFLGKRGAGLNEA